MSDLYLWKYVLNHFPEFALSLRSAFAVSQSMFGKWLKVSKNTIYSIEKGLFSPSLDLILKYFELLDIFERVTGETFFKVSPTGDILLSREHEGAAPHHVN